MLVKRYYYDDALTPFLSTDEKEFSLLKGTEMRLALSSETYCTGFSQNGEQRLCPKNAKGRKQCLSCAQKDERLPCLKCDGSMCLQFNEEIKNDCFDQEYVVYLASFGKDVKAGISKKERFFKRWVEQGADFACVVFQGLNGQEARLIESEFFKKGLLSRVTIAQKLQNPLPDSEALQKILESKAFQELARAYAENAATPAVEDMQKFYPPLDDVKPTSFLQGRVVGAKGPLLALEQNGLKAFPLPMAVGKKILEHTLAEYQTLE